MIAQSVAEILGQHVRLAVEGIDHMYLNVYVPRLQCETGVVWFFCEHRGQPLPSAALMSPMSPQVLHLFSVQCQAVPQWTRICQAPARAPRHRFHGARQRHPRLRRTRAPANNLRRSFGREDRSAVAQMAAAAAAPLHRGRPCGWLPIRHLHSPGRVLIDANARPAGAWPPVLRTGDPRTSISVGPRRCS